MARFNKAKNFAGKSYVVSNEIEDLIKTLTFDATNSTLKFGATTVSGDSVTLGNGVSFADWINAAKTAAAESAVTTVVGTATDTKDAETVYGAKAYARSIVDEVANAAIGIEAGDGIAISSQEGSTMKTISTDIKLVSVTAGTGATATYQLQIKEAGKDTYKSVGAIDIPKDMVATQGELVDEDGNGNSGTFIKMTVANGEAFYINVADLIEYNSYANSDTISFAQVEGKAHQYKFSVVDGSITTAKIADANVTTAKIADANVTTAKIADANVTADKLSDDAKALFDAAGKAQELIEALDSTQTATEGKYISGITQVDGKITAIAETSLPAAATLVTGDTNGTVKFNGTDIAVQGLKSAAFVETSAFDATGSAAAVLGSDADAAGAATVYGANKAAAAAQADANKIATAVNTKAVQFESADLPLSATTTSGTVAGRVIAVYGADGGQVYPEISFKDGSSTITVEGLNAAETFTVIYATTITIA